MPGTVIETLGDLVDNHCRVGAWCSNCASFRPLDLGKLIAQLGRDWRYVGRQWTDEVRSASDDDAPVAHNRKHLASIRKIDCGWPRKLK